MFSAWQLKSRLIGGLGFLGKFLREWSWGMETWKPACFRKGEIPVPACVVLFQYCKVYFFVFCDPVLVLSRYGDGSIPIGQLLDLWGVEVRTSRTTGYCLMWKLRFEPYPSPIKHHKAYLNALKPQAMYLEAPAARILGPCPAKPTRINTVWEETLRASYGAVENLVVYVGRAGLVRWNGIGYGRYGSSTIHQLEEWDSPQIEASFRCCRLRHCLDLIVFRVVIRLRLVETLMI